MANKYHNQVTEIIRTILEADSNVDPKKIFRPAQESDLEILKRFSLPEEIVIFYKDSEPHDCIEIGQARLWNIKSIIDENENYTPGYIISKMKFVVFSSTLTGDSFCFDLNSKNDLGDVPIIIASHDEIDESLSESEIREKMIVVSNSFADFLSKFAKADLPKDYYDRKFQNE